MARYEPFIIILLTIYGCSKKDNNQTITPPVNQDTAVSAVYSTITTDATIFYMGVKTGSITDTRIKEASGIVSSRKYKGFFWTHNDSGNPNDIYLIDSTGKLRVIVKVANATNGDWEDIAIGPGPDSGINYIYIGDIGDNNSAHYSSAVYRLPEPDLTIDTGVTNISVSNSVRIDFKYPDGPHNAETLLLDPLTKDLYVVSKGTIGIVYQLKYPQSTDTLIICKKIGLLPLSILTAGDISPDGNEILLKNYGSIYYWKKNAGETVLQTLLRTPVSIPYISEQQGEAIGWSVGNAFYTTSEYANGIIPGVYRYSRR
jgi:hypothetical protein